MSKIARTGMVTLDKADYQDWQLWTSQTARIGNFRQVQSSLSDYQNWQLWTSAVFSSYRETGVKDCQNW